MSDCTCSQDNGQTLTSQSSTKILNQTEDQTCPAVGYQSATVCVPVSVVPYAIPGATTTFCCGAPTVTPGVTVCEGTVNGHCNFTITQNICIAVPVKFGAIATVGAPHVQCGNATSEDICTDCAI